MVPITAPTTALFRFRLYNLFELRVSIKNLYEKIAPNIEQRKPKTKQKVGKINNKANIPSKIKPTILKPKPKGPKCG